jgi:hypothetical protein
MSQAGSGRNARGGEHRVDDIAIIIAELHGKGVRLWTENGQLLYQARPTSLLASDLEILRLRKVEIMRFLAKSVANVATVPVSQRLPSEPIPLTFAQQVSWDIVQRIGRTRYTRTLANAVRVSGAMDIECLQRAFAELLRRHEILRARIVSRERMEILDDRQIMLEVLDLTDCPAEARESRSQAGVEELVNQCVDITCDPLIAARVIKVSCQDHVLAITVDHIIADGTSIGILLCDLWTMYLQMIHGMPPSLPEIPLQFADYAVWEQKTDRLWRAQHLAYWLDRFAGAERVRITTGDGPKGTGRLCAKQLPIGIDKVLVAGLRQLSRQAHTTLVMAVLTVYIALVARWTTMRDIAFGVILEGRGHPGLDQTIGNFPFTLFMRLQILERDRCVDLLHRVTREYRAAYQHQDSGRLWADLSAIYNRNTVFNWRGRPRSRGLERHGWPGGLSIPDGGLKIRPFPFSKALMDIEWDEGLAALEGDAGITLAEVGEEVSGSLWYREDHAALTSMQSFVRNFTPIAEAFCTHPHGLIAELRCARMAINS